MGQIAFPLRHGRPYGAASASFTFLLAGGEFGGLLYGWWGLSGGHPPVLAFAEMVLPSAYVVAAAAAGVMFLVTRARSAELIRPAFTEPMDLETLRLRVLGDLRVEAERPPRSKTRQLLDAYHAAGGGAAGSARRH